MNIYGPEPQHQVRRWNKIQKEYSDVACPNVVKVYNEKMGGVDVCDQQMEAYRTFFKTKKWPLKVLIHFLDLAAVNSWMEYRLDARANHVLKKDQLDLMKYRLAVAEKLTSTPTSKRQNNLEEQLEEDENGEEDEGPPKKKPLCTPLPCAEKMHDGFAHWPVMDNLTTNRNCRASGCRSRTRVRCTKCNIYLCLSVKNNCFTEFHNK